MPYDTQRSAYCKRECGARLQGHPSFLHCSRSCSSSTGAVKNESSSPPRTLPRARGGPIEELFWAIRNNGRPAANVTDASGPLAAFVLSGHLAMFAGLGKRLEWDVEKMECTNFPEINRFARRDYRTGWEV